ncbi:porin [Marinomonas sp. C2222]|uniref:Porin n=1 Tax=Marinomonas sargassi TaxID=2984494 RepID=A0ABT2YV09_9GAMM|nr:porin [Marinomonas sargassi]MCV2403735.1 porin [Marinomonas sargassi]
MKKTIIALAVSSSALASVAAVAAEETSVDLYGNIQYALSNSDAGGDFEDNGSTFGIKGETEINQDTTAFFKYELEADADEKTGDVDVAIDQAFVGLKGGFGQVQIGSFDSIYNNAIQDSVDQYEYLGLESASLTDEGDTIAYLSPSFGGVEIQVASQVNTAEGEGNESAAVVKYTTGAVTLAAGYDSSDDTVGYAVDFQASSDLSLSAKFETTPDTTDITGVATRYGYGAGDVYASAQIVSPDGSDDYEEFAAGVSYNLASNVYVYGEVGQVGSSEETQSAVGVYYGF